MALSAYFVRSSFHTLCFWWRWETRLRQHVSTVNVMRLYIMYILNQLNCDFMPFIPVFCVLTVRNIWIHSSSFGPGKKVFFQDNDQFKNNNCMKKERKKTLSRSFDCITCCFRATTPAAIGVRLNSQYCPDLHRIALAPSHTPFRIFSALHLSVRQCPDNVVVLAWNIPECIRSHWIATTNVPILW